MASDAIEADTKLWLHVANSAVTKKLLFSPDTDVYHIGLTVFNYAHDVYVVISPLSSLTTKYLHVNQLLIDLAGDPSLALIPVSIRPQVLQTLLPERASEQGNVIGSVRIYIYICVCVYKKKL